MTEKDLRDMGFSGDWLTVINGWGTLENFWLKAASPDLKAKVLAAFCYKMNQSPPDIIRLPILAIVNSMMDQVISDAKFLDIDDLVDGLKGVQRCCQQWSEKDLNYSNGDHLHKYIASEQTNLSENHRLADDLAWYAIDCQINPGSVYEVAIKVRGLYARTAKDIKATTYLHHIFLKHIPDIAPIAATVRLLK